MPATACRCPECFTLAELMADVTGEDYGLARAAGHGPAGPELRRGRGDHCTGEMTCGCDRCTEQRALMTRLGSRDRPQPWEPVAA